MQFSHSDPLTLVGNIPAIVALSAELPTVPVLVHKTLPEFQQSLYALESAYEAVMAYPMSYRERRNIVEFLFCDTVKKCASLWRSPYWQKLFPEVATLAALARLWRCSTKSLY
ncbi:hypothetical protein ACFQMB_07320 [Pseudobowmanella zhangzhouensis]